MVLSGSLRQGPNLLRFPWEVLVCAADCSYREKLTYFTEGKFFFFKSQNFLPRLKNLMKVRKISLISQADASGGGQSSDVTNIESSKT